MDLRDAKLIICVAEEGNITSAAQKLFVSQPTLSQIIKKTEQDLQIKLFERVPSGLVLTDAGHLYVSTMRELILKEHILRKELLCLPEQNRAVYNVGISNRKYITSLPEIIPVFYERHPNVKIVLTVDSSNALEKRVLSGELDAAIVMVEKKENSLDYSLLEEQSIVLAASKETNLAQKYPNHCTIEISEAQNENFISMSIGCNSRDVQDRLFSAYKINPNVCFETNEMSIATSMISKLNAVLICPLINIDHSEKLLSYTNYYHLMHVTSNRHLYFIRQKLPTYAQYMIDFEDIVASFCSKKNG